MFKQQALYILSQILQAVTTAVNFNATGALVQKAYGSIANLSIPLMNIAHATYDKSIPFEQLTEQLTKIATQLDELDETKATEWVKSLGGAINDGKNIQYALDSLKEIMDQGAEETNSFIEVLKKSQQLMKKNDFLQLLFKGFSVWKSANIIIGLLQETVNLQKDPNHLQPNEQLICFYMAMACYISLIVSPVLKKILTSAEQAHTTLTENLPYLTTTNPVKEDFIQHAKKLKQESLSLKTALKKYEGLLQLGAALSAEQLDLPGIQEAINDFANTVSLFYTVSKLIPNSIDVLRNPIPRATARIIATCLWESATTCAQTVRDVPTTVNLTREHLQSPITHTKLSTILSNSPHKERYKQISLDTKDIKTKIHIYLLHILTTAISNKDLSVIIAVINTQGYDRKYKNNLALALIQAIQSKDDSLINTILQYSDPIDVNYIDHQNNSALIIAVINNCSPQIINDMITQYYANVNHTNSEGKTALFYAIEQGNQELVNILLKNDADINIIPNNETSLISMAQRLNNGTETILEEHRIQHTKKKR